MEDFLRHKKWLPSFCKQEKKINNNVRLRKEDIHQWGNSNSIWQFLTPLHYAFYNFGSCIIVTKFLTPFTSLKAWCHLWTTPKIKQMIRFSLDFDKLNLNDGLILKVVKSDPKIIISLRLPRFIPNPWNTLFFLCLHQFATER